MESEGLEKEPCGMVEAYERKDHGCDGETLRGGGERYAENILTLYALLFYVLKTPELTCRRPAYILSSPHSCCAHHGRSRQHSSDWQSDGPRKHNLRARDHEWRIRRWHD